MREFARISLVIACHVCCFCGVWAATDGLWLPAALFAGGVVITLVLFLRAAPDLVRIEQDDTVPWAGLDFTLETNLMLKESAGGRRDPCEAE